MRSVPITDHDWDDGDVATRTSVPAPAAPSVIAAPVAAPAPLAEASRWSDSRGGINWPAFAIAAGFNLLLIVGLVTMDVVPMPFAKRGPTVVKLIEVPPEPPEIAPPPEQKVAPVEQIRPVVVAPKPIVQTPPLITPPIQTVVEPPPVQATIVAPPPRPALAAPVSITDLSTSLRSGKAPSYPVESKRKREQGTVVIALVVSTSGRVSEASVFRSSGFDRLDQVALSAVRRFVYEPYVLNGLPVSVRTTVTFPFKLQG